MGTEAVKPQRCIAIPAEQSISAREAISAQKQQHHQPTANQFSMTSSTAMDMINLEEIWRSFPTTRTTPSIGGDDF